MIILSRKSFRKATSVASASTFASSCCSKASTFFSLTIPLKSGGVVFPNDCVHEAQHSRWPLAHTVVNSKRGSPLARLVQIQRPVQSELMVN